MSLPGLAEFVMSKMGKTLDFGGFESSLAYRPYFAVNKTLNNMNC